ncbi:MAG: hypothetical protein ACXACY_25275 [Candidatus Hodarchaeales archaeon]
MSQMSVGNKMNETDEINDFAICHRCGANFSITMPQAILTMMYEHSIQIVRENGDKFIFLRHVCYDCKCLEVNYNDFFYEFCEE